VLRFGCCATPPSMSDQIRLEVTCCPRFTQALDNLCSRLGKTRADTIRDALNFYENALNEWEKSNGSSANDKINHLLEKLREATEDWAKAQEEKNKAEEEYIKAEEALDSADKRIFATEKKVDAAGKKRYECEQGFRNFILNLHSPRSAQEQEQ
jgi:hypothetical protein